MPSRPAARSCSEPLVEIWASRRSSGTGSVGPTVGRIWLTAARIRFTTQTLPSAISKIEFAPWVSAFRRVAGPGSNLHREL